MSPTSKADYLNAIRVRYRTSSKAEKQMILDEFCSVCQYHRKYAIRLLNSNGRSKSRSPGSKPGRKKQYAHPLILKVLQEIWQKTNLPCSKRLKALLPLWLPHYESPLPPEIYQALLTISPATIDRLMSPMRGRYSKHGFSTTKPGSILKKQIPITTNEWDQSKPGFVEVDTVAHCGSSTDGMFVYTINCVDIATTWTEQRAVWGKGEAGVLDAIKNIETYLPFELKGFDSDNGSEFLNWHLLRHFVERKQPIQFTRSRPYHKNDNAHVEEKNWTHIRQYLGYQRLDDRLLVGMLNELYTTEWNKYFNFFIPSFKLLDKSREGSKIKKTYDAPKTPYQRVLESSDIPLATKDKLKEQYEKLNPFEIQRKMRRQIQAIGKAANVDN